MSSYLYDRTRRGLSLLTPPACEPVSLRLVKKHLRLEIDDDDEYLKDILIPSARQSVENYCRRALYMQKWRITLDRFPTWGDTDDPYFWLYRRGIVDLLVPPFMKLDAFKWVDTGGVTRDISEAFADAGVAPGSPIDSYLTVDAQDESVRLEPLYGQFWPVTQFKIRSVMIDYWTGYTDGVVDRLAAPADDGTPDPNSLPQDGDPLKKIPAPIKHAMLLTLGHFYEHREEVTAERLMQLPVGAENLLSSYRSITF